MMVFGLFSTLSSVSKHIFFLFEDFVYSYVSLNYLAVHAQHNALQEVSKLVVPQQKGILLFKIKMY